MPESTRELDKAVRGRRRPPLALRGVWRALVQDRSLTVAGNFFALPERSRRHGKTSQTQVASIEGRSRDDAPSLTSALETSIGVVIAVVLGYRTTASGFERSHDAT